MFKNYLKIAFRNVWRNKVYSFINILGLATGITGAVLLYLYVESELSYDAFHDNADRIYRIVEISENEDGERRYYGDTAPVLGTVIDNNLPEIDAMTRVYKPRGHIDMEWKGERLTEREWLMADPNFFTVFDFEFVHGDPNTAMTDPNSVVLSIDKAVELFGEANPVGEQITFIGLGTHEVTGVVHNVPRNSHLQFELVLSRRNTNTNWDDYMSGWDSYGAYVYVMLAENVKLVNFEDNLDRFIADQQKTNEKFRNFYLQPITDIYFGSADIEFGVESTRGNIFYVYVFSAIGVFLLIIAGINYMNLATALSVQRSKEIGIRKAAGADKKQLVGQFLAESIVFSLLACFISYFFIELLLPYFNDLTGKEFYLGMNTVGSIVLILISIGLIMGLLAGSYPAFHLAFIRPVQVLKSNIEAKGKKVSLRKILVVSQFSLSIILIIGTLIIQNQINYIRNTDLGFDEEKKLIVDINHSNVRARFQTIKQEIEKIPNVTDVAVSSRVPGERKIIDQVFARPLTSGQSADSVQSYFMSFDEDMLNIYDLNLLEGRNFTGNKLTDSLTVLLNETAVKEYGLESPVGKRIHLSGVSEPVRVIGVLEDFKYQSLHYRVQPLIVGYWANPVRVIDYFTVQLSGSNYSDTIDRLKEVHRKFDPATAMEYHFLNDQIDMFYETEYRAGKLFLIGGSVTIFIACLGLFGLTLYTNQRRTQEIGVRKVLGANVYDIVRLLTVDSLKLVLIAYIIAIPAAWFVMNNWLQNFAYHASIGIGVFLIAGIGAILISLLTISYQAVKAAFMDPVHSLRQE